jgi:hypothetical protein
MTIQYINTGTSPNAGNGDSLRVAFSKVNSNFSELYGASSVGFPSQTGHAGQFLTTDGGTLSWAEVNGTSGLSTATVIVSNIAPGNPVLGELWYDDVSGRLYVWYDTFWVDASPRGNANVSTLVNGTYTFALTTSGSVVLNGRAFTGGSGSTGNFTFVDNTLYATPANTKIGTDFNTNPPGHTVTLQHNGGISGGSGGELTFDYGTAEIKVIKDTGITQIWKFASDGMLTLPAGASISNGANSLSIQPVSTSGEGAVFQISAGMSTDNIGGDLRLYAGQGADFGMYGSVDILGNNTVIRNELGRWEFGADGALTLPNTGTIGDSNGLLIVPGSIKIASEKISLDWFAGTVGGNSTPDGTDPQDYGYPNSTGEGSGGAPGTGGPYKNLTGYTRPLISKSFTIECWVKWDIGASITGCLFGGPTDDYWQPHFLTLYVGDSTTIVTDSYWVGANQFTLSTPLEDDIWYHIAVSRDHANGDLEAIWINGVLVDSHVDTFIYPGNSTTVSDGWPNLDSGGDRKFQGKQADLRVVAGVCLYDPTVSTITVPTSPLSSVSSTVLMLSSPETGPVAVDSSANQVLTFSGNIEHSSDSPYAGGTGSWHNTDGMGRITISPGIYFAGERFSLARLIAEKPSPISDWDDSGVLSNINDFVIATNMSAVPDYTAIKSWKFGTDGTLTFPNGTTSTTAWNTSTAVYWDQIVDPQGQIGPSGPAGQGFNFRGAWSQTESYVPYDVVTFGGGTFINVSPTTSGPFTIYWRQIAVAGADGPTGPSGADGPTGPSGPGGNVDVSYTPAIASDWAGDPPITIQEALDRLAAAFKIANGTGA